MKYVQGTITAERGWFHPIDRIVNRTPGVEFDRFLQMELIEDGTITTMQELSGDREMAESEVVEDLPGIIEFQVSPKRDGIYTYANIEPNSMLRSLLEVRRSYRILSNFPVEYVGDGRIRLLVLGNEGVVTEALTALPDGLAVDVEKIGSFSHHEDRIVDELTDRQFEIARIAVDMGYYDTPRNATYEDIATRVDVTPGTVGSILRKVEATLLQGHFT